MFTMFSLGWIGGGDAKLAAAAALWIGWGSLLDFGLSTAIYGGVLTVALMLMRKVAAAGRSCASIEWLARLHHPEDRRALWHRARRRGNRDLPADRPPAQRRRSPELPAPRLISRG